MTKKILIAILSSCSMAALSQTPTYPPGGGGGGGSVTSVAATGTALVNATVVNPTTTPTVVLTLPNQPANSVVGNFTGTAAAPVASATPTFSAVNLNSFPTGRFAAGSQVSAIQSGLIAEYHFQEANGATAIVDYSGAGNTATAIGNPLLTGTLTGGMQAASGSTYNGNVLLPAAINSAITMQVYTCVDAITATAAQPFYDILVGGLLSATTPSGGSTQALGLMLQGNNSPTITTLAPAGYGRSPLAINNNVAATQAITSFDGCHLLTWVRGSSSDTFYIDGVANPTNQFNSANTTGTSALNPTGTFAIGAPPYGTGTANYAHPYPIYFFNAYNRALTASEVLVNAGSIQTSMQTRGVIKNSPGTGFLDNGNQIIAAIDSITFGFNTAPVKGWPAYLSGLTNNVYNINNIATVSWQLENAITECQSRAYGSFNPGSNTTMIVLGGTNDLAGNAIALPSVSAATTYSRLRRLVQCYKGATPNAPRVFVMTMLSRSIPTTGNGGLTMDVLKNQYNDLIRKDYAGADGMIDVASFAGLGADGASINPTAACAGANCFTGDGTHPSTQGQTQLGTMVAAYLNWADAKNSGTNPRLVTANTTEAANDVALAGNPGTTASFTITLPTAVGLVGTDRYINNVQTTGANTLTIAAAGSENIDGNSTLVCPNATKCAFRSVLGSSPGLAAGVADSNAGAHWEQFGFSGGGGGGTGNATSIQGVAVSATAPTSSQVLAYNTGTTSYVPATLSGTTVPTCAVGTLGSCSPDGTTITVSGGVLSAAGGGAVSSVFTRTGAVVATTGDYTVAQVTGAAPIANATFTGTTTASTFNAATYQKGGGGVRFANSCAIQTTTTSLTYTCTITGGTTTSPCWASPMNAAAAALWSGTASITAPLAPNIPFAAIASGSTLTITFASGALIQPVVAGATFSAACSI